MYYKNHLIIYKNMLIQIIGIAALVLIAYLIANRLSNSDKALPMDAVDSQDSQIEDLTFEEEMSEDELSALDESINENKH